MTVTLHRPNQSPLILLEHNLSLPDPHGYAKVTEEVARILNRPIGIIDILASDTGYVVYSIFNSEGEKNLTATAALQALLGQKINLTENEPLLGDLLIIQAS